LSAGFVQRVASYNERRWERVSRPLLPRTSTFSGHCVGTAIELGDELNSDVVEDRAEAPERQHHYANSHAATINQLAVLCSAPRWAANGGRAPGTAPDIRVVAQVPLGSENAAGDQLTQARRWGWRRPRTDASPWAKVGSTRRRCPPSTKVGADSSLCDTHTRNGQTKPPPLLLRHF
jgi:hypothetical protein